MLSQSWSLVEEASFFFSFLCFFCLSLLSAENPGHLLSSIKIIFQQRNLVYTLHSQHSSWEKIVLTQSSEPLVYRTEPRPLIFQWKPLKHQKRPELYKMTLLCDFSSQANWLFGYLGADAPPVQCTWKMRIFLILKRWNLWGERHHQEKSPWGKSLWGYL